MRKILIILFLFSCENDAPVKSLSDEEKRTQAIFDMMRKEGIDTLSDDYHVYIITP